MLKFRSSNKHKREDSFNALFGEFCDDDDNAACIKAMRYGSLGRIIAQSMKAGAVVDKAKNLAPIKIDENCDAERKQISTKFLRYMNVGDMNALAKLVNENCCETCLLVNSDLTQPVHGKSEVMVLFSLLFETYPDGVWKTTSITVNQNIVVYLYLFTGTSVFNTSLDISYNQVKNHIAVLNLSENSEEMIFGNKLVNSVAEYCNQPNSKTSSTASINHSINGDIISISNSPMITASTGSKSARNNLNITSISPSSASVPVETPFFSSTVAVPSYRKSLSVLSDDSIILSNHVRNININNNSIQNTVHNCLNNNLNNSTSIIDGTRNRAVTSSVTYTRSLSCNSASVSAASLFVSPTTSTDAAEEADIIKLSRHKEKDLRILDKRTDLHIVDNKHTLLRNTKSGSFTLAPNANIATIRKGSGTSCNSNSNGLTSSTSGNNLCGLNNNSSSSSSNSKHYSQEILLECNNNNYNSSRGSLGSNSSNGSCSMNNKSVFDTGGVDNDADVIRVTRKKDTIQEMGAIENKVLKRGPLTQRRKLEFVFDEFNFIVRIIMSSQ